MNESEVLEWARQTRAFIPITSGHATNKDCEQLAAAELEYLNAHGITAGDHEWFNFIIDGGKVVGQWAYSETEAALGCSFWWRPEFSIMPIHRHEVAGTLF